MSRASFKAKVDEKIRNKIFTANILKEDLADIFMDLYDAGLSTSYARESATQTGTAAPVLVEAFNNTGAAITPARTGAGVYTLTFASAVLVSGKTTLTIGTPPSGSATIERTSATVATVRTFNGGGAPTDAILSATLIEVEISGS